MRGAACLNLSQGGEHRSVSIPPAVWPGETEQLWFITVIDSCQWCSTAVANVTFLCVPGGVVDPRLTAEELTPVHASYIRRTAPSPCSGKHCQGTRLPGTEEPVLDSCQPEQRSSSFPVLFQAGPACPGRGRPRRRLGTGAVMVQGLRYAGLPIKATP